MGLFKKAKKKLKKVAKVAKRATAAVVTGGLSETSIGKNIGETIGDVLVPTSIKDLGKGAALVTTGALAVTNPVAAAGLVGTSLSGTSGGMPMSLGNILGGVGGILNTVSQFGGSVGTAAQIGSGFLTGFLPAQGPMVSQFPTNQFPQAQPVMALAPSVAGAIPAIAAILLKIGRTVGRNVSFRAAMIIIRRLGKSLGTPQAVATALGITSVELASMLVTQAVTGSRGRRMNVGNIKALRRAHRRIQGFHKICGDNDRLRAPRRRASQKTIVVSGKRCD